MPEGLLNAGLVLYSIVCIIGMIYLKKHLPEEQFEKWGYRFAVMYMITYLLSALAYDVAKPDWFYAALFTTNLINYIILYYERMKNDKKYLYGTAALALWILFVIYVITFKP